MKKEFADMITDADLVLIGIGTEFEAQKYHKEEKALEALSKLKEILDGKNYFVISTCTNSIVRNVGFNEERIVCPCGNIELVQCTEHCENSLRELTVVEQNMLKQAIEEESEPQFGRCECCGNALVLNNVYASKYDEDGYLKDWTRYTKWLQGTLNKKLCILELGVNLSFPTIIRWPFEKVAFYNQKASFVRVNEKLYHMSEELKDKGTSVAKNSIDWLLEKDI